MKQQLDGPAVTTTGLPALDWSATPTRFVLFTGKGGVGKTTVAAATAVALADAGLRVLLVSTDPASNLSDVFEMTTGDHPLPVGSVAGLDVMDLDPQVAADEYRSRVIDPYRGVLPDTELRALRGEARRRLHRRGRRVRHLRPPPRRTGLDRRLRPRRVRHRADRSHPPPLEPARRMVGLPRREP